MTNEEAIEYGNLCIEAWKSWARSDCEQVLFYQLAIKALEKQIPKKPKEKYINSVCIWECPVCGRLHRNEFFLKFCSECGQAIDWSEEDE